MEKSLELNGFYIDTVRVVPESLDDEPKVQMVRYSVLASDAEDALKRFFEDEAGVVVEETDPTDLIVVGMGPSGPPGI